MTMLRFKPEQRVGFREYMRSDGTRSYFFCLENLRDLVLAAGFIEVLLVGTNSLFLLFDNIISTCSSEIEITYGWSFWYYTRDIYLWIA